MEEHASFLKHLKYDPKLGKSWIAKYLNNFRLLILLLILVIGVGIFSFLNLPRRLNPSINIPIVSVVTILPGAGPSDVETLVTVPIEDAVKSIDKVKDVSSTSRDSVSMVTIEFEAGTNADSAKDKIQSAVDSVNELPEDAIDPNVTKFDFENQPVWQFAITSKNNDLGSLSKFSKNLKEKLEDLDLIDRVEISGLEEQEIQILIKPEAIATYKINPQILTSSIKSSLNSFPAGIVNTKDSSFSLTIDPSTTNIHDLRKLKVNLDSSIVNLEQVATITERTKPEQKQSFIATKDETARPAIAFNIYKTSTADITKAVNQVKKETEITFEAYPNSFTNLNILDLSEEIEHQFNDLYRDFFITVGLVFLVLIIFLGSRQALIASVSIPLSFLITLIVMYVTGTAFSFISTFSLLLALGLVVDDTIVIVSAMTSYSRARREGSRFSNEERGSYFSSGKFSPMETGLLVWRDFVVPVFTTTITTIWAFIPLLLASGIIGEFIKPIPIVVSTTLIASFIVAMFMTMPIMIILLKPNIPTRIKILFRVILFIAILAIFALLLPKNNLLLIEILVAILSIFVLMKTRNTLWDRTNKRIQRFTPKKILNANWSRFFNQGLIDVEQLSNKYQRFIQNILKSPSQRRVTIIMVVIFSLFSFILVPFGFVRNEFFPKTDEDFVYVSLQLPSGTNLETAKKEAIFMTNKIRQTQDLKFATTNIGQGFGDQGPTSSENNNILITLTLNEDRKETSSEIAEDLRNKLSDYQKGEINVIEASGGPPAGADVQIELLGDDLTELDTYANKTVEFLKNQKGTTNIQKSIKPGTSKLVFKPNNEILSENNLDVSTIGFWLRTYTSGFEADNLRDKVDNNEEKDITIRMATDTQQVDSINSLTIPTANGNLPIASLGSISLQPNPTLITRKNSKRSITISSAVTTGTSSTEINQKLLDYVQKDLHMKDGYSYQTGGANEENQNSINSILQAMILSFALIIITMVLQFRSFRKALIVMLVIPLSVSGVFIVFALSNTPLSFPALIGMLALFGIVVKNSILVVDKISANENTGMSYIEAIAEGASSRIEAIALTSIATIFGLLPITFADPLWRGLGGAIIAGLTFSGTIMLFFIPVVYFYLLPKKSTGKG